MGKVKVMKLGEDEVKEVSFEGETVTLETVLEGVDTDGYEVTVNGEEPTDEPLKDGDTVTLVPDISGG